MCLLSFCRYNKGKSEWRLMIKSHPVFFIVSRSKWNKTTYFAVMSQKHTLDCGLLTVHLHAGCCRLPWSQNILEICGKHHRSTQMIKIIHLYPDKLWILWTNHSFSGGFFDSTLLRRDQCEKKAPASTVTDNNLTLIFPPKAHGACSPVWTRSSEWKHFC